MLLKTDPSIIQSYLEDSSGLRGGHAESVVIPDNEREIAEFLREATARRMPVTISAGGTNVTGSRIPFGGAVLSVENFNRIKDIRPAGRDGGTAIVGAGVIVHDLKREALACGCMYPPDPTEQTSFIGGNVATNASGSRGLKFGSTRKYIHRIRVVLSTGEITEIIRGKITAGSDNVLRLPLEERTVPLMLPSYRMPRIKNAAGYYNSPGMDLIDLFIGQEGTLGVVTEVEVLLKPPVTKILAGVAFFSKREDSWDFVAEVKKVSPLDRSQRGRPGIDALSLEYFDRNALELLKPDFPLIPGFAEAAVLFEADVSDTDEASALESWGTLLSEFHAPLDNVWMGTSAKEQEFFRNFRHRLPERVNEIIRLNMFPKTGTDLAVPDEGFRPMMRIYSEKFKTHGIPYLIFGHVGENHLHANLLPRNEDEYRSSRAIYAELVGHAVRLGGTVSAEHGIGKLKHDFLRAMVGEDGVREMVRVKRAVDPAAILGMGNIFPAQLLMEETLT